MAIAAGVMQAREGGPWLVAGVAVYVLLKGIASRLGEKDDMPGR